MRTSRVLQSVLAISLSLVLACGGGTQIGQVTTITTSGGPTGGGTGPTETVITSLTYNQAILGHYTQGTAITPRNPKVQGGAATSFAIKPNLPDGLSINPTTGVISGTPLSVSEITEYTVTASNSLSSVATLIRVGVQDLTPSKPPTAAGFTIHLNQAIQMPDDSVPIIEGRTTAVQLFANTSTQFGQNAVLEVLKGGRLIATASGLMPTSTSGYLNLVVAGLNVVSGNNYRVTVGNETVVGTFKTVKVPRIPITLIPVIAGGIPAPVHYDETGRTLMERTFIRLIPQPDNVDFVIGNPFSTPYPIDPVDSVWGQILMDLDAKRKTDAPDRIYYGLIERSDAAKLAGRSAGYGLGGLALGNGLSAVGLADNYSVFAHEFGHNAGLPDIYLNGLAGTLLPDYQALYPYSHGEVRGYGFDILGLKDIPYEDSMCPIGYRVDLMVAPNAGPWISDYHWKFMITSLNTKVVNASND